MTRRYFIKLAAVGTALVGAAVLGAPSVRNFFVPLEERIAKEQTAKASRLLLSNQTKYREKVRIKEGKRHVIMESPVSFKQDLERRIGGTLAYQAIFDAAYTSVIKEYQDIVQYGFDKNLVMAVAAQESGGNLSALSRAGARGIMQYMPGTARDDELIVDQFIDERRDPEKSIPAATKRLAYLTRQFKSVKLALAAYNAGENKTKRLMNVYEAATFEKILNKSRKAKDKKYKYQLETELYPYFVLLTREVMTRPGSYGVTIKPSRIWNCEGIVHEVQEKETLNAIARGYGIHPREIRRCNPSIINFGKIPVNYPLKIPI